MTRALRLNALVHVVVGALLLAATWDRLYQAFDLPPAQALSAQIGGAAFVGFAYLLWIAPRNGHVLHAVAAGGAVANAFAATVIFVWLAAGEADAALLWVLGFVLAAFALVDGWIASRRTAMLMPGD